MSKTIRRPAPTPQDRIDAFRRQRGVERRVHFETGGTPSSWRGIRQVIPDASKDSSRTACRGTYVTDEDDQRAYDGPDDDWGDHLKEGEE